MRRFLLALVVQLILGVFGCTPSGANWALENSRLRVNILQDGSVQVFDKTTEMDWTLGSPRLLMKDDSALKIQDVSSVSEESDTLSFATPDGTRFEIKLNLQSVDYSVNTSEGVAEVLLLDQGLPLQAGEMNYYAIPHRLGIMVPVEGAESYTRRFPAYATGGGYSMAMAGAVKDGSAILLHWEDPYTEVVVDYTAASAADAGAEGSGPRLTMGISLRQSANLSSFRSPPFTPDSPRRVVT